jgi:IS605 OrfB family transposase
VLKRLGRQRSNRTRTFAQTAAKQLVTWAPSNAVLVFEDLRGIPAPARGAIRGTALRRRLALWQRRQIRQATQAKAEERGLLVTEVDARYTSQTCSGCGRRGRRARHVFACPSCGLQQHADVNAAINIGQRYSVLRYGGPSSTGPEAQARAVGKSSPSGGGR